MSRPAYITNPDALAECARDLGLKLDVRVTFEHLRPRRGARNTTIVLGRYNGVDCFHPAHRISVNPNQTQRGACAALYHELIHALQCERIGSWPRFDSEHARQCREVGALDPAADYYALYRVAPFEAEAYAAEAEYRAGGTFDLILSDPSSKMGSK